MKTDAEQNFIFQHWLKITLPFKNSGFMWISTVFHREKCGFSTNEAKLLSAAAVEHVIHV